MQVRIHQTIKMTLSGKTSSWFSYRCRISSVKHDICKQSSNMWLLHTVTSSNSMWVPILDDTWNMLDAFMHSMGWYFSAAVIHDWIILSPSSHSDASNMCAGCTTSRWDFARHIYLAVSKSKESVLHLSNISDLMQDLQKGFTVPSIWEELMNVVLIMMKVYLIIEYSFRLLASP